MNAVAREHTPHLSRFAFSDLALRSAIELDRAGNGSEYETAPLRELADALERAAYPDHSGAAPFKFVEPGFYQAFESLYQLQRRTPAHSVDELQEFMGDAIMGLRQVEDSVVEAQIDKKLIAFCIALHRELIRELSAEGNVVQERRYPGFPTTSGFC
jgi:hypothetical protein